MERRYFIALAVLAVATLACAVATPPPAGTHVPGGTPAIPFEFVPTAIHATPTSDTCSFIWGSKELPELSQKFNAALQEFSLNASGLAYAFGENCVYPDGRQSFGALETDFRVRVIIKTVRDEAALGDWIMRVMQVVLALPQADLEGPQPGRVDFDFRVPDPAEIRVRVPIDVYRSDAQGLRGIELFRFFYTNP